MSIFYRSNNSVGSSVMKPFSLKSLVVITSLVLHSKANSASELSERDDETSSYDDQTKWWNSMRKNIYGSYSNVLADLTGHDGGRLFNTKQDYVISVISDFSFSPQPSDIPIANIFGFRKFESRGRKNPSFLEQMIDLIMYRPDALARSFFTETTFTPTVEFIFPAPISFPSFSYRRSRVGPNVENSGITYKYITKPLVDIGKMRGFHVGKYVARLLPEFSESRYKNLTSLEVDLQNLLEIKDEVCRRRFICEAFKYTVGNQADTLNSEKAKFDDNEFFEAMINGITNKECSTIYSTCKSSFFESIVDTLIQKTIQI
ncbi:Uncharacterised protein at_DN0805 [Pycnogonum litorale]